MTYAVAAGRTTFARESHLGELSRLNEWHRQARQRGDDAGAEDAANRLREAAQAANDAGISWTDIGAALGMRRGNAYQRFRRRPAPSSIGLDRSDDRPRLKLTDPPPRLTYVSAETLLSAAAKARRSARETRERSARIRAESQALRRAWQAKSGAVDAAA